jgi:hypothetical protein
VGFFGRLRGLGLATATTSAAFLPHWEQAHPWHELFERHPPADDAGEGLRLNLTTGTALAHNAHEEIAEAAIEPLDVSQDAHPRMMRRAVLVRPCSARRAFGTVRAARASSRGCFLFSPKFCAHGFRGCRE